MDANGDKTLDINEFTDACKEFKVNLTVDEVKILFNWFDRDGNSRIDYNEFLRQVRGEMNDERRNLAERAFNILDKNRNGIVEIADIAKTYNAKMHPAVQEGRKSEEQVLSEFLETFETHHNLRSNGQPDSRVNHEEFLEYYNNVSASIDDDKYFEQVMDSSWNLSGVAATYNQYNRGWTDNQVKVQTGPSTY